MQASGKWRVGSVKMSLVKSGHHPNQKSSSKIIYPGTQRTIHPPAATPPRTSDSLKNGTPAATIADEDWPVLEAAAPLPDLEPEAAEDPLPVADAAAPEVYVKEKLVCEQI